MLRHTLKSSVTRSTRAKKGHQSDQGAVWDDVSSMHASYDIASETSAMSDAYDAYQDSIQDLQESLKYVDGAGGLAVAVGKIVKIFDVFDKPATCQKVWDRLLSGVFFDPQVAQETDEHATTKDVESILDKTASLPWEQVDAVGDTEAKPERETKGRRSCLTVCWSMGV